MGSPTATAPASVDQPTTEQYRERARKHLGPFFTPGERWHGAPFPVFVRGEGCYVHTSDGERFFDGLAGLLCVNLGHGRSDIARAAADQMATLPFAPLWAAAHPAAIEAATRIAAVAPADLDTVFFVNSGSEATETALKYARQYHRVNGEPARTRFISRELANHGTTVGAMSVSGLPGLRAPFLPGMEGVDHVPNTLRAGRGELDGPGAAAEIERAILGLGPDTVAGVFAEPVQNSGGAIVPPPGYWAELRRICDRHGVLLIADEVICSFGRLGHWFSSVEMGATPDIATFAKGASSGYAPVGGVVVRRSLADGLLAEGSTGFSHGATWGGHPVSTAVVSAVIDALERDDVLAHVRDEGPALERSLREVAEAHRCVKEVRGTGFLYAIELTADVVTGRELTEDEATRILRDILPASFRRTKVILRGDNRGGTLIMIAPPLVADRDALGVMVNGLDGMLTDIEASLST